MAPQLDFAEEKLDFGEDLDYRLEHATSAVDRVRMIVDHFGADAVTVLTSFGVQSGIMLSLVAEACPEVRVLYIDTQGSTSERDLEYGRHLLDLLGLHNFAVAKAAVTRDEFRSGMREVGVTESDHKDVFHKLSQDVFKVAPLKKDCAESGVKCLLSGVRRGQTSHRDHLNFVEFPGGGPAKGHPILDWTDEGCIEHLRARNIPPHPELSSVLEVVRRNSKEPVRPGMQRRSSLRSFRKDGEEEGKEAGIYDSTDDEEDDEDDDKASGSIRRASGSNRLAPGSNRRASGSSRLNRQASRFRSFREERGQGQECGIHVQDGGAAGGAPVPTLPNVVVGKVKCRFCRAAKELLSESDVDYVEAPVSLFPHLIPAGTKTVPVVYLNKQLIGGYGNLCEHLGVEDTLNDK